MVDQFGLWVVDTSSLIQVRQAGMPATMQAAVFRKLTDVAKARSLIFPAQVRDELEWAAADHPEDQALAWIRRA